MTCWASPTCRTSYSLREQSRTRGVKHDSRNAPVWTTPGAYEVAPGVHRIPLPLPNDALRAVNVYTIEQSDGLVLIDSGWALTQARSQLEAALASLGHRLSSISQILVTHVHRDHYTQAVLLRREFGTSVAVGMGEWPSLDMCISGIEMGLAPQLRRLHASGASSLATRVEDAISNLDSRATDWEFPDEWLVPGKLTIAARSLEAVATPGHTRGHLCFRDADAGLLFAGDHVLPHITPSIGFEPALATAPLADYLQSLRLVREQPDAMLLPAHGPTAPSVHARVDELLVHHDTRLQATYQAVIRGAATAYNAACLLPWTRRARHLDSLDPFNQMLAVLETAAHLDLLVMQGRARSSIDQGITQYAPQAPG